MQEKGTVSEKTRPRGPLKFKGVIGKEIKRQRKEKSVTLTESSESSSKLDLSTESVQIQPGSGRIVVSGVTVNGFETKFKEEVSIGDVLIIFHPKQLQDEERVVVSMLSQRCLSLNEPLSGDIPSTVAYRIRKDSALLLKSAEAAIGEQQGEEDNLKHSILLQDEISRQLQKKLSGSRPLLQYREKTGMWGYKVVSTKIDKKLTAEELLDLRSKKQGRDKYCW